MIHLIFERYLIVMTFERLDDTTLRCILTEEDLEERGFGLNDFLKNPYKIHGFLREMIETAALEFDMDIKEGMLALQVAPLPNNELAITFSVEDEKEGTSSDMASQIKKMIGSAIAKAGIPDFDDKGVKQETEKLKRNETAQKSEAKPAVKKTFAAAYRFKNYEAVEKFALHAKSEGLLKTSLYRSSDKEEYLFVLQQGKETIEKTRSFCLLISEYAQLVSADETYLAYLNEHYQLIMKDHVIRTLQVMA
ncbi:MAG: adaptor protein MecA [Lachnospiraceae bacterium]|nr:adaptor protein MecA [Lachnospiraceae bacterium]